MVDLLLLIDGVGMSKKPPPGMAGMMREFRQSTQTLTAPAIMPGRENVTVIH